MSRLTRSEPYAVAGGAEPAVLTPYQFCLLDRLDHVLTVAAPAVQERWQSELVAHTIRHLLAECDRAGIAAEATARLRQAVRRSAAVEEANSTYQPVSF